MVNGAGLYNDRRRFGLNRGDVAFADVPGRRYARESFPPHLLHVASNSGIATRTFTPHGQLHFLSLLPFDFPCLQHVLATARRTERGIALEGSWADLDSLAGWVAGEANHARRNRRPRQTELLDSIADQLEDILAAHRR